MQFKSSIHVTSNNTHISGDIPVHTEQICQSFQVSHIHNINVQFKCSIHVTRYLTKITFM